MGLIKSFGLLVLLLLEAAAFPQTNPQAKCDYVWPFSNALNLNGPSLVFDFNSNPFTTISFNNQIRTDHENSSICDANGNLLFYTNGMFVANRNGQIMPHGDSLNYGYWYDAYLPIVGYHLYQGAVILPLPDSDSLYFILHLKYFDLPTIATQLLYSVVNMNANSGLGDVIVKNQRVFVEQPDTLVLGGLAVVRHANGRDWWIIVGEQNYKSVYRVILGPNGLYSTGKQDIGFNFKQRSCVAAFSPDGCKYAILTDSGFIGSSVLANHPAAVYDFDRTLGVLSNCRKIDFIDTNTWVLGASFSANSRFLYSGSASNLIQWDSDANDIAGSKTIVGSIPTATNEGFGFPKLGPDGKIYIQVAGNSKYMHVVNQPDNPGITCNLVKKAIILPVKVPAGMPNHPNFRLGNPLGINETLRQPSVRILAIPNPAKDHIQFELDIQNNHRSMQFDILNILGAVVSSEYYAPYQGMVRYDATKLADGLYFAILKDGLKVVGKTKFIIKH